ncbi:lytic transglycosylase domain-containing protein [Dickeya sp. NCPPB 3274]|uniref:lytic transglycosylase domain-containing protein n=1 Tax=Dickeya sp. NCPPB 3274 TaxID=568766 RepID=UPI0006ACFF4D|nr:lytic transglycosylase domain-containing protein [Dickeya sp. NCPPB 3274]
MRKINLILLMGLALPLASQSAQVDMQEVLGCILQSANKYKVDPLLIEALASTESELDNSAVNYKSADGFPAYTMMQISGWWFSHPHFVQNGITLERIKSSACSSIDAGSWILATNFADYGVNWNSVGIYNTGTKPGLFMARKIYIEKVKARYGYLKKTRPEYKLEPDWAALPVDITDIDTSVPFPRKKRPQTQMLALNTGSSESSSMRDEAVRAVTKSLFKVKGYESMELVGGL